MEISAGAWQASCRANKANSLAQLPINDFYMSVEMEWQGVRRMSRYNELHELLKQACKPNAKVRRATTLMPTNAKASFGLLRSRLRASADAQLDRDPSEVFRRGKASLNEAQ